MKLVLKSALCASLLCVLSGCGSVEEQTGERTAVTRPQALVDADAAAVSIAKKWKKLGGVATVGYSSSAVTVVPNGLGAYQRYQKGVIVYSDDFGAVLLNTAIFNKWLGLSSEKTASGKNLFDFFGFPKADSEHSIADSQGMDRGTFERGVIISTNTATLEVHGDIYERFMDLDGIGLPTAAEADAAGGGRYQTFTNGEIYWKDGVGAFAVSGESLTRWKSLGGSGGSYGFPTRDSASEGGGASGHFQNGALYYSSATGHHEVTRQEFIEAYDTTNGGPSGWLGFPISNEGTVSATGDRYIDFEGGILVLHKDADNELRVRAFGAVEFYLDRIQGRDDDCFKCGQLDLNADVNVTVSEGPGVHEHIGTWDNDSDHVVNMHRPLIAAVNHSFTADVSVHVYEWDAGGITGSGDTDDMGELHDHYSIENLWGHDEDSTSYHDRTDLSVWFTLNNIIPYGDLPYRQEQWWTYQNFSTDELTYRQFALTFRDVQDNESWWNHPFNKLFYQLYKGLAAKGNCFGMGLESIYSDKGRNVYPQPLSRYLPELAEDGEKPTGSNDQQKDMINNVNVKMGYQLGMNMVSWVITSLATGRTHNPMTNFSESWASNLVGEPPLLSIFDDYLFHGGHSVRPYEWVEDGDCGTIGCSFIKVADPNHPWGETEEDTQIEIHNGPNEYHYEDREGDVLTGARMFFQPFRLFNDVQYTPLARPIEQLRNLRSLMVGNVAKTQQITDGQGRTFFRPGLTEPPTRWDDVVADDAARVPNLAPLTVADGAGAEMPIQMFVSQGVGDTHQYDIVLAPGQAAGTNYDAVFESGKLTSAFSIPGTPNKADRIAAHDINDTDKAISFNVPSGSNSKKITWTIAGGEKHRWAELSELEVEPGQTITLRLDHGGYNVIIDNDGPATTAHLRTNHGVNARNAVNVGTIDIPSGKTSTQFELPKTTITVTNETFGKNGWLIAPVDITLDALDYSSFGIDSIQWSDDAKSTWSTYSGTFTYTHEGDNTFWYFATDKDQNEEIPKSREFKIDTRVPVVSLSTGVGVFTRVAAFAATGSATDPMPGSGIDTFDVTVDGQSVQANADVDLFWFPLGTHVLAGHAIDVAGWDTSKSATFEVHATLEDLPETIRELGRRGQIDGDGAINSLVKKAEAALASKNRGNVGAAKNELAALLNELSAQTGKKVTVKGANLLRGDVNYVVAHL